MACELELHGEIAAIRFALVLLDAPDQEADLLPSLSDTELDDLKDELTTDARRIFDSTGVEITDVQFERGSLEVLVVLVATATVVKEFGSVVQGLQAMARIVPRRVRRYIATRAQRVFGRRVAIATSREPVIEMGDGMLAARPAYTPAVEGLESPEPSEKPRDALGRVRGLVAYVLVSHAVLTLALTAITVVLLIEAF